MSLPGETQALVHARMENFPVASWLLPKRGRQLVWNLYCFARAADNIADDPSLTPHEKKQLLEAYSRSLQDAGHPPPQGAERHVDDVLRQRISGHHGAQLLQAFRWDAENITYPNWEALLAYCRCSANPVGRLVLEACLPEDSAPDFNAADALCTALQLLNHAQDMRQDYTNLQRVYLPQDWMHEAEATVEMLKAGTMPPALRIVYLQLLDHCDDLLHQAEPLPASIDSARLRMETAVIHAAACALAAKLRLHDPLAKRIRLNRGERLHCALRGMVKGYFA